LTVVTEDHSDLIPLTPAMFLHGIRSTAFPESTFFEASDFSREYERKKTIQSELRQRFRNEYLSQLVQRSKQRHRLELKVRDVVLVGSDEIAVANG
jgi:hypothetical protein